MEPSLQFQDLTVSSPVRAVIKARFLLGICSKQLHLLNFFSNSTNAHVYYFNYCAFNTMTELDIGIHASSVPGSIFVRWIFTDWRPSSWFLLYLLKTCDDGIDVSSLSGNIGGTHLAYLNQQRHNILIQWRECSTKGDQTGKSRHEESIPLSLC